MYHLVIDTCIWIELCKKLPELRGKIADLVERKKVRLVLPSVVIEEWRRQKPKILEERRQSVRGMIKNARALSEYLDAETADEFRKILDGFQEQTDSIEDAASRGIKQIEDLFDHPTTIILEVTDTAKMQAVDTALAKKAPFRTKNSMADALIVFSATEYIAKEGLANCMFISSNTQDFSATSDSSEIHEDLSELFEGYGIEYFANVGLAINRVETDLISEESVEEIEATLRLDALREAFQSFHEYNRQLAESLRAAGDFPVIQELVNQVNRQLAENLKTMGGLSVMQELANRANRQLAENLRAAGEFPVIQELVNQVSRQFAENLKAAGEFPVMQELVNQVNRQFAENLKAVGGLSVIRALANQVSRQFAESLKRAGDFAAVNEAFDTTREDDRQYKETLSSAENLPGTMTASESQKDELVSPDNTHGDRLEPDDA